MVTSPVQAKQLRQSMPGPSVLQTLEPRVSLARLLLADLRLPSSGTTTSSTPTATSSKVASKNGAASVVFQVVLCSPRHQNRISRLPRGVMPTPPTPSSRSCVPFRAVPKFPRLLASSKSFQDPLALCSGAPGLPLYDFTEQKGNKFESAMTQLLPQDHSECSPKKAAQSRSCKT